MEVDYRRDAPKATKPGFYSAINVHD